jgi:hypothetical protein
MVQLLLALGRIYPARQEGNICNHKNDKDFLHRRLGIGRAPQISGAIQNPWRLMMMEESITPVKSPVASCVLAFAVAALIGGAGIGYAVYEHHGAQMLAAKNAQVKAQLNSKQGDVKPLV